MFTYDPYNPLVTLTYPHFSTYAYTFLQFRVCVKSLDCFCIRLHCTSDIVDASSHPLRGYVHM